MEADANYVDRQLPSHHQSPQLTPKGYLQGERSTEMY